MKCRFCECRINDDVEFCPFCGAEQHPKDVFIIDGVSRDIKAVKIRGDHVWILIDRPNNLPDTFYGRDMVIVHDNKDYQLTDCWWHGDKDPDGNWYYGHGIHDMWYDGLLRGHFMQTLATEFAQGFVEIIYDD
jgi:hypothetical protein